MGVDAEPVGEPAVPLRHRRRHEVRRAVRDEREHERVAASYDAQRRRALRRSAPSARRAPRLSRGRARPAAAGGSWCPSPPVPAVLRDGAPVGEHAGRRSTSDQRSAHSSPRRAPVVIVSQTSVPQSGSSHAASTIRAASSADGGCGSGRRAAGARPAATGFVADPPPAHALLVGAAEDEVDVPDRRRRQAACSGAVGSARRTRARAASGGRSRACPCSASGTDAARRRASPASRRRPRRPSAAR